MRWVIHIFLLLSIGLMTHCRSVRSTDQIPADHRFLEFDRSPCYGYCPVYSVVLFQNRELYFIGERFVPVVDTLHFRISKEEMSTIKNIMNSADYQNMVIDPQQDEIMDAPRLLFSDRRDDWTYDMDVRIPEPIRSITHHIDEILKNKALLYDDKDLPMQREEVIISLTPNTKPGSIIGARNGYELYYIKEIGHNIHLYEIIAPSSYLSQAINDIRAIKRVQEIQKNHPLDRRNNPESR